MSVCIYTCLEAAKPAGEMEAVYARPDTGNVTLDGKLYCAPDAVHCVALRYAAPHGTTTTRTASDVNESYRCLLLGNAV